MGYVKHTWETGEWLSADGMNHIEEGIEELSDSIDTVTQEMADASDELVRLHTAVETKADEGPVLSLLSEADKTRADLDDAMADIADLQGSVITKAEASDMADAQSEIDRAHCRITDLYKAVETKAEAFETAMLVEQVSQKADVQKTAADTLRRGMESDITSLYHGMDSIENAVDRHSAVIADIRADMADLKTDINGSVPLPANASAGTVGQVLSTNGDGTTAWIDPAEPSDEQIAEVISDWLDEHPEATTTVEDGSVTMEKLSSEVQEAIENSAEAMEATILADAMSIGTQADMMEDEEVGRHLNIYYENQYKLLQYASYFGAEDGFGFLFFSDPHTMSGRYGATPKSMLQSMRLIKTVFANTPAQYVLCGGDWINIDHPLGEALLIGGRVPNLMRTLISDRCYTVVGNHDGNWVSGIGTLTPAQLAKIWFDSDVGYYMIEGGDTTCFAFDSNVDTGSRTSYSATQLHWFAQKLMSNTKSHLFGLIHIVKNVAEMQYAIGYVANNLTQIATAFNRRESITFDGITYNFSSASGTFHFLLGGHLHGDDEFVLNGIPVFLINSFAAGSLDCCYADFGNAVLHMVRIGPGSSREGAIIGNDGAGVTG